MQQWVVTPLIMKYQSFESGLAHHTGSSIQDYIKFCPVSSHCALQKGPFLKRVAHANRRLINISEMTAAEGDP